MAHTDQVDLLLQFHLTVQPHVLQQTAQGAPVTIKLDAQILKDSTPAYDFAWTRELSPNAVPVAATAAGAGPQTLTTGRLKVIDMFGQVAQTQALRSTCLQENKGG